MVENLPANPGDVGSVPVLGGPPGEGNGNPLQHSFFFFPLQHSCLENLLDRGAWWAMVHGVEEESDTASF